MTLTGPWHEDRCTVRPYIRTVTGQSYGTDGESVTVGDVTERFGNL